MEKVLITGSRNPVSRTEKASTVAKRIAAVRHLTVRIATGIEGKKRAKRTTKMTAGGVKSETQAGTGIVVEILAGTSETRVVVGISERRTGAESVARAGAGAPMAGRTADDEMTAETAAPNGAGASASVPMHLIRALLYYIGRVSALSAR